MALDREEDTLETVNVEEPFTGFDIESEDESDSSQIHLVMRMRVRPPLPHLLFRSPQVGDRVSSSSSSGDSESSSTFDEELDEPMPALRRSTQRGVLLLVSSPTMSGDHHVSRRVCLMALRLCLVDHLWWLPHPQR